MISTSEIIDALSKIVDYINLFIVDCREKENSIQKLEEAVFWLTYLNESDD
ncbi:MAG: hypothetical protein J6B89_03475 [Bacilli bacterium]|nr:hypothetical protein [Bacilli bacterium]